MSDLETRRKAIISAIKTLHVRATKIYKEIQSRSTNDLPMTRERSNEIALYNKALQVVMKRLNSANRECSLDARCMEELRNYLSVYNTSVGNALDISLAQYNQPSTKAKLQTMHRKLIQNEKQLSDLIRPSSDPMTSTAYETGLKMDIVQDKIHKLDKENKKLSSEMRTVLRTGTEVEEKYGNQLRELKQKLGDSVSKQNELKVMLAATEQKLQNVIADQAGVRVRETSVFKNLKRDYDELTEKRAEADRRNAEILASINKLKKSRDNLQASMRQMEDNHRRELREIQDAHNDGNELHDIRFELQESKVVDELRRKVQELTEEKKQHLSDLEELQTLREQKYNVLNEGKVPERILRLAQNYQKLSNQQNGMNAKINVLIAERDELQSQLAQNEISYTNDINMQTQQIRGQINDLRNSLATKQQEIASLMADNAELNTRLSDSNNEVSNTIQRLKDELNELREQNEMYKRNSETCEVMKSRELNLLRQQHAHTMSQRDRIYKTKLQQIREKFAVRQVELTRRVEMRERALEQKAAEYETARRDQMKREQALKTKADMLKEEVKRLNTLNNAHEQDLVNLRNELRSTRNELELTKAQTITFQQREQDLKDQIVRMRKQHSKQLDALNASFVALRGKHEEAKRELMNSKIRYNELVQKAVETTEELKVSKSRLASLESKHKLQAANYEQLLHVQKNEGKRLLRDNLQMRRMLDDASNAHAHAESWKSEAEHLQSQINAEEKRANSSMNAIRELTKIKSQQKKERDKLNALRNQLQAEKDALTANNEMLERKVQELTDANLELSRGLSKMNQQARNAVQTAERQMLVESKMREGKEKMLQLELKQEQRKNEKMMSRLKRGKQVQDKLSKILQDSNKLHAENIVDIMDGFKIGDDGDIVL